MTNRRRFFAAFAALLGLTGVLVFGGSLAAQADNGLFFDESLSDATFTSTDTFTFSGTTELLTSDLVIYRDGEVEICRVPAAAVTPDWACETTPGDRPPLGEHLYTVQQITDPLADPPTYNSDAITMTIELPQPTITAPTDEVAGSGLVQISGGNGYPGAEIVVTVVDPEGFGTFCDTGVLDTFGNWSCERELDDEFASGSTVTVRAIQFSEGADEEPTSAKFSFDIAPGDVRFDDSFEGADILWSPTAFAVSGTTLITDLASPIVVYSGADQVYCTDVDSFADGTWSCTPVGPPLDAGFYAFSVVQDGQSDTVDLQVRIPEPQLTLAGGEPYTDPYQVPYGEMAVMYGTTNYAPNGTSYIQVDVPGHDLCSVNESEFELTAPGTWSWSCTIDTLDSDHLFEGGNDYPFTVRQEDDGAVNFVTGNHTLSYGNPLPEILQIDEPTEAGSPYEWAPDFLTISGVAHDIDETVDILVDDAPLADCQDLAVDFEGNWSCPATDIPWGAATLVATQENDEGGETSAEVEIYVQLPAPVVTQSMLRIYDGDDAVYSGTITYPGANVEIYVAQGGAMVQICTTEDPDSEVGDAWECPIIGLPVGHYDVTESQVDGGFSGNGIVDTLDVVRRLAITSPATDADVEWMDGNFFTVSGTSAQTGAIDVYLDYVVEGSNTPFCTVGGTAPTWTCDPIFLAPGTHTLRVEQNLQPSADVSFDVLLPPPGLPDGGFTFQPGDSSATIGGTVTYADAWTRVSVHEDFGEGYGDALATATCPMGTAATFSCELDLSGLAEDRYVVVAEHFLPGQPTVQGAEANGYVYIESGLYEGPTLECVFGPGSATISSPDDADIRIYSLVGTDDSEQWSLAPQGYCGGDLGYTSPDFDYWNDEEFADCAASCDLSDLAPGIYEVYYGFADEGGSEGSGGGDKYDYLFRVPERPSLTTVVSSANAIAVSGTATRDDIVRVVSASGATLCSTAAATDGSWACGFTASAATTARAISVDPQSGGMSGYSEAGDIPAFLEPPTAPTVPIPAPGPGALPTLPAPVTATVLVNWLMSFDGDLLNLKPGDKFSVTLEGMPAGWTIEIVMHSTPVVLGTATATGAPMTMQLTVPDGIESGAHRIEVVATTPLGTSYFQNADANVIAGTAPVDETEDPATEDGTGGDDGGSNGAADRTDPGAPSALSDALAPLSAIVTNPASIAIAGGLALALLFLVALPTELLNSSLSSNTSRLGRAYGAVDGAMTKAKDWFISVTRSRALASAVITLIVAIVYGFVDPHFGFDIVSLRLVLSLGIAFFLLSFVASWISGLIIRRAWGAIGVVEIQPSIILFAIVGVIVARILDFSPGFLVGLAIGLELLQASRKVSARAIFVQIGVVTGLALAAWVVYSFFTPGNDFFGMLLEDTMVATTAEGLTGALIAIIPLKFLDGHDLWAVSKRLWIAAFAIVATAFALLVLPTAIEGTDVGDYGTWLLVFAAFGLVSVLIWLIFVRADAKAAKAEGEKVDA